MPLLSLCACQITGVGRNLWLLEYYVPIDDEYDKECDVLENAHYYTMQYTIRTVSNITMEKSGSNVEWVLVCVRNLIFCTDENESEIQFSIHLMHLNALPRALEPNSEQPLCSVVK